MYENQAEAIIKKCADAIRGAKEAAFGAGDNGVEIPGQNKAHLENVFFLVEKYLKDVCKIYTEQKAIRVKRVVEKKNM
jgi:syntaxin 18